MKRVDDGSQKEDSSQKRNPLVLYVEDNAENRYVTKLNLGATYDLLFAVNDREACQILATQGQDLSLILMDIELQESILNGVELTELVRGTLKRTDLPDYTQAVPKLKTPILFVTAYSNVYERTKLLLAGGDGVVDKPVNFSNLEQAMAKYRSLGSSRIRSISRKTGNESSDG